ncbi:hypothetical protein [Anaeroselena agilis]|uniref:Uncharacterized protein n=1 Tax=Anaeroselena agilis TaxID=3063788 RepID=A0ABU3NWF8_9FIRM|nr:hypothetical protein [Selenomonadales bacterium 4137-cl]
MPDRCRRCGRYKRPSFDELCPRCRRRHGRAIAFDLFRPAFEPGISALERHRRINEILGLR